MSDATLPVARSSANEVSLLARMANRHGLIAGATGTGKTITLQTLAEGFSALGVPVFLADIKGDLGGLSQPGGQSAKVQERVKSLGLTEYRPMACPVTFWDVFGEQGHPVRATVSEMGPMLLGRLLNLNDTQAATLEVLFKIADDHGLLLLDLKDLQASVQYLSENASAFTARYGNLARASLGAIQRNLLALESQGADRFFAEPALNLDDLIQTDANGRGMVNILAADKLMQSPRVYATMLLWMLSELFERLPEVGDQPKPKLVFFFDEAHLLFNDVPTALLEKIEQVVRLVRSKGVGVYFVTQNPRDVPDRVLGQLGNRIQHALRAFTPLDRKAVLAAAQTFRSNPAVDTTSAITELGIGEALISLLDEQGQPAIVERAFILPPRSQIGPITAEQRRQLIASSPVAGVYEEVVDRESAYERLSQGHGAAPAAAPSATPAPSAPPAAQPRRGGLLSVLFGGGGGDAPAPEPGPASPPELPRAATTKSPRATRQPDGLLETMAKSTVRTIGSSVGREIVRGVLGSIFGGRRR